jgi:hypothetical protein
MPNQITPIAQVLAFATLHSFELVTDGVLRVRLGQDGPEIMPVDAAPADHEEEHLMSLHVVVPEGLNLLRLPHVVPSPRYEHGWRLQVKFPSYNCADKQSV